MSIERRLSHLVMYGDYSLRKGIITATEVAQHCKERSIGAVAMTNCSSMIGLLGFQSSMQQAGINPIIGSELTVRCDNNRTYPCVIIAKNFSGYKTLSNLLSLGYKSKERIHDCPIFDKEDLHMIRDDTFCIALSVDGELGQTILHNRGKVDTVEALTVVESYQQIFGVDNYVIDVTRIGRDNEELIIDQLLAVANKKGCPVILSNHVCMLNSKDIVAHKIKVSLHAHEIGEDQIYQATSQQYLKSYDQMASLMNNSQELLDNANFIANQCHVDVLAEQGSAIHFPIHKDVAKHGALNILTDNARSFMIEHNIDNSLYRSRLNKEIKVLTDKNFLSYIYTIYDIVNWAKTNNIPVGPGRGSGAGSLLAYCLGITTVDPIKYGLLFERFLNVERNTIPDFDIDFCVLNRKHVIQYIRESYGDDYVGQIITYLRFGARSSLRDCARILGVKNIYEILSLLPATSQQTSISLREVNKITSVKKLLHDDIVTHKIMSLSMTLENRVRGYGKHAAGVIVTPKPLVDYMTMYHQQGCNDDMGVTNYDKDDIEALGLIKIDILGLSTLTNIDNMLADIESYLSTKLNLQDIPLDDKLTFDLISSGNTCGIFQLEGFNMQRFCQEFKPNTLSDLAVLISLYRPGPLASNLHKEIAQRKQEQEDIDYFVPCLKPILKETYGIITYQEQIMSIVSKLAGLTLGEGDKLQRSIGKKNTQAVVEHLEKFYTQAVKKGYSAELIKKICDYIKNFGSYGFNKSHAYSYAMLTYYTAYIKAHYKHIFYKNICSIDMKDASKVSIYLREHKKLGYKLLKPDLRKSQWDFSVEKDGLRMGLGTCSAVNSKFSTYLLQAVIDYTVEDLYDLHFILRDQYQVNHVGSLKKLVICGALDSFHGGDRSLMLHILTFVNKVTEFRIRSMRLVSVTDVITKRAVKDFIEQQMTKHQDSFTPISARKLALLENDQLHQLGRINLLKYERFWMQKYDWTSTLDNWVFSKRPMLLSVIDFFMPKNAVDYKVMLQDSEDNVCRCNMSSDHIKQHKVKIGQSYVVRLLRKPYRFKSGDLWFINYKEILHIEAAVNSNAYQFTLGLSSTQGLLSLLKIVSMAQDNYSEESLITVRYKKGDTVFTLNKSCAVNSYILHELIDTVSHVTLLSL